jgi:hypothetical protein
VLTGGWSVVAAAFAFWITERGPKRWRVSELAGERASENGHSIPAFFSRGLFIGGALSLFGLVPAAAMSWGATEAEQISAARIYAYFRISHHLMPAAFHLDWYIRHAVLTLICVVGLFTAWRQTSENLRRGMSRQNLPPTDSLHSDLQRAIGFRILGSFAVGAMGISVTGLLLGTLPAFYPDQAAKLLRFYWFRLADAITPLVFAFLVVHFCLAKQIFCRSNPNDSRLPVRTITWLSRLGTAAVIGLFAQACWERIQPGVPVSVSNRLLGLNSDAGYAEQRQTLEDWIDVCKFVRASAPEDAVLLTPRHQQTFKWYAHRAEVVNWKDTPQNAVALREWAKRFLEVYPNRLSAMRVTIRYDELRSMRAKYGCEWIVVDRRVVGPQLPLVQIYPASNQRNSTYAVYELP